MNDHDHARAAMPSHWCRADTLTAAALAAGMLMLIIAAALFA
jgi:hypothetical protein